MSVCSLAQHQVHSRRCYVVSMSEDGGACLGRPEAQQNAVTVQLQMSSGRTGAKETPVSTNTPCPKTNGTVPPCGHATTHSLGSVSEYLHSVSFKPNKVTTWSSSKVYVHGRVPLHLISAFQNSCI